MQKYFLSLMFWRCATVTPHNINDSCMTMQHSKISWDANWFAGLVLDTQLMYVNSDEACSLATRHLLNTVSFFISFVLPPLIKNSAVMLCEGEPTGTAFESRPQKQRHKERLGRVCRGDWDEDWDLGSSRKHPRETQKPSLSGRGMGGREKCERLWRRNEHCELTRSEGWGLGWASLQGLGHLCWPCHLREGTGWTPTSVGHLGLEQGGLVDTGRGSACPTGAMSRGEFILFSLNLRAVSISCNRRSLAAGVVFHFSCLMWCLWLSLHRRKLGWGQNRTILVSNIFRSLLSIPAVGRAQTCSSCYFSVWQTYWSKLVTC